jgi:PAS domain S-box-containing protein
MHRIGASGAIPDGTIEILYCVAAWKFVPVLPVCDGLTWSSFHRSNAPFMSTRESLAPSHKEVGIDDLARFGLAPEMVLNNAIVGICFVANRTILWANPRMEEILAYAQGEPGGAQIRILYASEAEYESDALIYRKLVRNNRSVHERQMQKKGGEVIWCMLSGRLVDARDSLSPSVWILQDISDRKKAQD